MGWVAYYKNGTVKREDDPPFINEQGNLEGVGRPVADGESGELLCIAQEDFGHSVAVDLINGIIAIDYELPMNMQNGTLEMRDPKLMFYICEETNIVGQLFHLRQELIPWYGPECRHCGKTDENNTGVLACPNCGKKRKQMMHDGQPVNVRNDIVSPIIWRPIWFTRMTNGIPTKVIGAQTTTPEVEGARNVKKLVMLFNDGRIGID